MAQTAATQSWQADVVELDEGRFAGGFKVSDSYTFLAPQINPRTLLRIKQKDIDFLNPHVPTLTIGDKSMTLTSYQRQNRATQRQALQVAQTAQAQATSANANAKKAQETVVAMKDKLEALQKEADEAGLSNISATLSEIKNQLTSLFTNLGDMGTEIEAVKDGQTTASGQTLTSIDGRLKVVEEQLKELGGTTNGTN
jgi:archaellum component FlaC